MANLHTLKVETKKADRKRVGRGGKRGKTSGRGHKGQKQHGGHGIRPEMRDTIKRLPKLRGHGKNRARTVNSARVVYTPVNIAVLDASFKNNDTVSPKTLAERGIVATRSGRAPAVKILGKGEIKTAVTVEGCKISVAARTAIEKAGGTIR